MILKIGIFWHVIDDGHNYSAFWVEKFF